jgi:hypothetical protein
MASTTALPSPGTSLVPDVHDSFEGPKNRFALATIGSSPVLPRMFPYLHVGDELFIPAGVHSPIERPIYQSSDGGHYAVLHADDTLVPIKVLKEVVAERRVFGLHEWHYRSDGRGGFALTRDSGGPSEREIEAMALTQSQRLALLAGAPPTPRNRCSTTGPPRPNRANVATRRPWSSRGACARRTRGAHTRARIWPTTG